MNTKTLLATTALVVSGSIAFAAVSEGEVVGTNAADIQAALEAKGYTVSNITIDGDEIEIDVSLNGEEGEIEVSAATGEIIEIEVGPDDDADNEDEDEEDDDEDDDQDDDESDDDEDDD